MPHIQHPAIPSDERARAAGTGPSVSPVPVSQQRAEAPTSDAQTKATVDLARLNISRRLVAHAGAMNARLLKSKRQAHLATAAAPDDNHVRAIGYHSNEPALVPTAWQRASPWLIATAMVPIAFGLLFLRRPETLTQPAFWADDSEIFDHAIRGGVGALGWSYAGTLIVIQRLISLLEATVPSYAPLIGSVAAMLVVALVASFIVSPRLAAFLPGQRTRIVVAIGLLLLPATGMIFWSLAYVQWFTGTYLAAMLVATPSMSRTSRAGDAIGLLLAGLTGPLSIILLPLYLLRAREPTRRWPAAWLGLAAVIQTLVYVASHREATGLLEPNLILEVILVRGGWAITGLLLPPMVAVVLIGLIAVVVRHLPKRHLFAAAYIALVIPLAGILGHVFSTRDMLSPEYGPQYFYLGGVVSVALVSQAVVIRMNAETSRHVARPRR